MADDDRAALLGEAYKRGLLPPDMKAAYEEAQKRGLVQAPQPSSGVGDFLKSIPRGIVSGFAGAASAVGQSEANLMAGSTGNGPQPRKLSDLVTGHVPDQGDLALANAVPGPAESTALVEQNVTGPMHQPEGPAGKVGAAVGEALGDPGSYLGPGGLPSKIAIAAGVGAGSELLGQAAEGTRMEIPARIAGGFAGGLTSAGVLRALDRGTAELLAPLSGTGQGVRDVVAPMTEAGQTRIASETLRGRATNPDAAAATLATEPLEIVPGSQPTTFQASGDMGLGALEREVATKNPVEFNQLRSDQNVARRRAVGGLQESGSSADVSEHLRLALRDLDAVTEQDVTAVTARARAAAEGIGGTGAPEAYGAAIQGDLAPGTERATSAARTAVQGIGGAGQPEGYGAALRGSLADARAAAKAHERALWNAVDPDGTLALPSGSLRQAASGIEASVTQSARPIAGEERAILDTIGGYQPATPFRDITDLRSRISTAMREELRTSGETPVYARLARLRSAIEATISNGVEHRAAQDAQAVARGEMSPQQTMAAMLQRAADERDTWLAQRSGNARTGGGGSSSAAEPGAASAVSPALGAESQGGGRLPGTAGDQGLPEGAALQPNFDAAAQERLRAASAATRQRKQTFDSGPVGTVLRSAGMQGQYRTLDAMVPGAIFKPGPGGFEAVQAFRRAAGNDQAALGALQDYAAASLRRAAERPDGTLDPARYAMWRRQHQDALRGIPGLQERFENAARASQAVTNPPLRPDISAAHVPETFFHPGPGGFEDVQRLRGLIGDDRAQSILGDYAASRLRQAALREDGTLDPGRFSTWRRQHSDALRAFPELETRFSGAAQATEAIGEAAAARKAALDEQQQGAIGKLIGLSEPQDVTRVIGGLFGQKNAVQEMRRLATATAKDPAARAGLRKAIVEHIANKFIGNTEGATSGAALIKSDAFQTFIRQNNAALRQVFSEEEASGLRAIAADLQRANRSITAVKLPGGSNTAQDQAAQQLNLLRTVLHHASHVGAGAGAGAAAGAYFGPIGALVGAIGGAAISGWRQAGLQKIDDLIKTAMLDPKVASMLLQRASTRPDRGPAMRLAHYLNRTAAVSIWNAAATARTDDGHRSRPVQVESPEDVHRGSERTEIPSPAQAEANNYRKRHVAWKGLDISIETEAGQDRVGMGKDGKPWSVAMPYPYGYVKRSKSADGEQLDVTMGPNPQAPRVFVVDQRDPVTGKHDEPKTFVGFRDQVSAEDAYHASFSDGSGPDRMGAVTSLSVPEFKKWVADGDLRKPLAYDEQAGRARARQSPAMMAQRPSLKDLLADDRSAKDIKADLLRRGVLASDGDGDGNGKPGNAPSFRPRDLASIGAKRAPDGNWYLPDPQRPGKYLMVSRNAA
jgi:hypothetical protein